MTFFQKCRHLGWLALFSSSLASAQDLSFAQPLLEHHTVALVIWTTAEGGNGHFYEVVSSPEGITWADAESYAEGHGGYLATIASARENIFVFKLIDSAQFWFTNSNGDSWGPWLGGVNSPPANSSGAAWQWLNHEGAFTYTNWTPAHDANDNQPNHRLIFFGPGRDNRQPTWSFATADQHLHGFVVEYDTNPLPPALKYVALFGVSVVGLIALSSIIYFAVRWRRGKTAAALRLNR
jgi:hypothetical protein